MADLLPVTLEEQIAEVRREVEMRKRVYGKAVLVGSMNRRKADRQIDVMQAVLATLEGLAANGR